MSISDAEITDTVESAAVAAIDEYETTSRTNHRWMPEYWITCQIASALANKGLIVECEKRLSILIPDGGGNSRIDLVVYNEGSLRALIEVKRTGSGWPVFPADFMRLMTTAKSIGGAQIGLVYGTGPMLSADLDQEERTFEKSFVSLASLLGRALPPRFSRRSKTKFETVGDVWEVMSIFERV